MTDEELIQEAARWDERRVDPKDWTDSPGSVPRGGEAVQISLRMPSKMLEILREFAQRQGVGYQVLMKRWLDDRIRQEHNEMIERGRIIVLQQPEFLRHAASFVPTDEIAFEKNE
jgi:hypothetical protein